MCYALAAVFPHLGKCGLLFLNHHVATSSGNYLLKHIVRRVAFRHQQTFELRKWASSLLFPVLSPTAGGTVPKILLILIDLA
eukprot:CAMPEP_0179486184 /NCGR_PEP_ID=MMETSP0799-20121207/62569_1 /TAXON_ID=46947 /ORGANISM="Geminigera cryophila, Strain CCMP2564" /LENGTH=81 /DNA_ID=CAMNT_0021300851 /DNA_START=229 /DNA_END=471 /DNA_ORIENTATION=-